MKTYRLKNNYYNGIKLYRKGVTVYKFDRDYHYSDNGDDDTFINSAIVENNPDIFELIEEPEPQEEVIEGWAYTDDFKEFWIYKSNEPDGIRAIIPATLILNPKPKKEYVRWVTDNGLKIIKNNDYRDFESNSKQGDAYSHKITITVEE
jgi:hypothetical protein